jgi:hypothetical protein
MKMVWEALDALCLGSGWCSRSGCQVDRLIVFETVEMNVVLGAALSIATVYFASFL